MICTLDGSGRENITRGDVPDSYLVMDFEKNKKKKKPSPGMLDEVDFTQTTHAERRLRFFIFILS